MTSNFQISTSFDAPASGFPVGAAAQQSVVATNGDPSTDVMTAYRNALQEILALSQPAATPKEAAQNAVSLTMIIEALRQSAITGINYLPPNLTSGTTLPDGSSPVFGQSPFVMSNSMVQSIDLLSIQMASLGLTPATVIAKANNPTSPDIAITTLPPTNFTNTLAGLSAILTALQNDNSISSHYPNLQSKLSTNLQTWQSGLTASGNSDLLIKQIQATYPVTSAPMDLGDLTGNAQQVGYDILNIAPSIVSSFNAIIAQLSSISQKASATPPVALTQTDVVTVVNALVALRSLAVNGLQVIDPNLTVGHRTAYLTKSMLQSVDVLSRGLSALGIDTSASQFISPSDPNYAAKVGAISATTVAKLQSWIAPSNTGDTLSTAESTLQGARIAGMTAGSEQAMTEVNYVTAGVNMLQNQLTGLNDALNATQQAAQLLGTLQKLHNYIDVSGVTPFAIQQYTAQGSSGDPVAYVNLVKTAIYNLMTPAERTLLGINQASDITPALFYGNSLTPPAFNQAALPDPSRFGIIGNIQWREQDPNWGSNGLPTNTIPVIQAPDITTITNNINSYFTATTNNTTNPPTTTYSLDTTGLLNYVNQLGIGSGNQQVLTGDQQFAMRQYINDFATTAGATGDYTDLKTFLTSSYTAPSVASTGILYQLYERMLLMPVGDTNHITPIQLNSIGQSATPNFNMASQILAVANALSPDQQKLYNLIPTGQTSIPTLEQVANGSVEIPKPSINPNYEYGQISVTVYSPGFVYAYDNPGNFTSGTDKYTLSPYVGSGLAGAWNSYFNPMGMTMTQTVEGNTFYPNGTITWGNLTSSGGANTENGPQDTIITYTDSLNYTTAAGVNTLFKGMSAILQGNTTFALGPAGPVLDPSKITEGISAANFNKLAAQVYGSTIPPFVSLPTGVSMTDALNELQQTRALLAQQLAALQKAQDLQQQSSSNTSTAASVTPLVSYIKSVLQDLSAIPDSSAPGYDAANPTTGQYAAQVAFSNWILDGANLDKNSTDPTVLAKLGKSGAIQNNLQTAITASTNLNATQQQQFQQYMTVFSEFMQSAAAILTALLQTIRAMIQGMR